MIPARLWAAILLLSILPLKPGATHASPATFAAHVDPVEVRGGETITLWLDVTLSDDWHIYAPTTPPGGPYPTEIRLTPPTGFRQVGTILQPPPEREHDPNFDTIVEYYGGTARFGIRAQAAADVPEGPAKLAGTITYMLCNATSCLPPTTQPFEVAIQVVAGAARTAFSLDLPDHIERPGTRPKQLSGTGSVSEVNDAVTRGLGAFLYLAVTMGFLALLTPCVFPMVPITVSFFTKQQSQTRSESLLRSLAYCLGIVVTFTGLGLLLAATLGASGASLFAANPWINLFITAIFVAFALSLFGLFEIRLPSALLTRLSRTEGGGYAAILVMGFTFTLTSFTCTAPFVGALLVLTSQGTWLWPLLGMLAFSAAFASPFFFLALFPQALSALPKSGGWLNAVKVVMGFLELAAAMKFLSNADLVWGWGLISREVFIAFWIAVFGICGLYLLGKVRLPHDSPTDIVGPARLMFSLVFVSFSLYLGTGLVGAPLGELDAFFPPYGSLGAVERLRGAPELTWESDYDVALASARETGKPVFLDFTGYACTNCRWMEANVFTEPEIRELLSRYVRVRLYTDGQGEVYDRNRVFQQSRFGTVALPFYAIVSPDDRVIAEFAGLTRDRALFRLFLEQPLESRAGSD